MNFDVNTKIEKSRKLKNSLAESREFKTIENTINECKNSFIQPKIANLLQ
jgi:hypothetical protein